MLCLPVEALEDRPFLVRVDFLGVNPVVHQRELDAVRPRDVPVEACGGADAVEVGVAVAEELVVCVGRRGLAPCGGTFRGVEDVAQLDIDERFYVFEPLILHGEAGLQLERVGNILELVEVVGIVRELKLFANGEIPVSGVVLAGQVQGEAMARPEGVRRIEVPDEDVFPADIEIVADLVFEPDGGLMPFYSSKRFFCPELISCTEMKSLPHFPVHFRRCPRAYSRTPGGSVRYCQPYRRQCKDDSCCRLEDFFRRFHVLKNE